MACHSIDAAAHRSPGALCQEAQQEASQGTFPRIPNMTQRWPNVLPVVHRCDWTLAEAHGPRRMPHTSKWTWSCRYHGRCSQWCWRRWLSCVLKATMEAMRHAYGQQACQPEMQAQHAARWHSADRRGHACLDSAHARIPRSQARTRHAAAHHERCGQHRSDSGAPIARLQCVQMCWCQIGQQTRQ